MAIAKLTPSQIASFIALRTMDATVAKTLRKTLWAAIKAANNIPSDHTVKAEIDNTADPLYGVILRKSTGNAYEDGHEVSTASAPTEAWFQLDLGDAVAGVDAFNNIDDGGSDPAPDTQAVSVDGYQVKVADEAIYVLRTAADLS